MSNLERAKVFYDREYDGSRYASPEAPEQAIGYAELLAFIDKYNLHNKRCLEVGCGRGLFQDLVEYYTGIDLSDSVRKYLHNPFYQSSATELPFGDSQFDAVWTISVLEHILNPEIALMEMQRVLKPTIKGDTRLALSTSANIDASYYGYSTETRERLWNKVRHDFREIDVLLRSSGLRLVNYGLITFRAANEIFNVGTKVRDGKLRSTLFSISIFLNRFLGRFPLTKKLVGNLIIKDIKMDDDDHDIKT